MCLKKRKVKIKKTKIIAGILTSATLVGGVTMSIISTTDIGGKNEEENEKKRKNI